MPSTTLLLGGVAWANVFSLEQPKAWPDPKGTLRIDTLVEHASAVTSPKSYCIVFQLGGALNRVDAEDTAYGQRDAAHNVAINAVWTEDDPEPERHIAWARDLFDALRPHASGRVYVNFLGDEGQDRVRAAYGERNYERLARLKRVHDPTNFFRLNQNIQPG